MESLAKPGSFSAPDSKEDYSSPKKLAKKINAKQRANGTEALKPFYFIFCDEKLGMECEEAPREAYLKDPIGDGQIAILEFGQWWWIDEWDEYLQTHEDEPLEIYLGKADVVEKITGRINTWKAARNVI
jgi:hypothetical protein